MIVLDGADESECHVILIGPANVARVFQGSFQLLFTTTDALEDFERLVKFNAVLESHILDFFYESAPLAFFVLLAGDFPRVRHFAALALVLIYECVSHAALLLVDSDAHGLQVHLLVEDVLVILRAINGPGVEHVQPLLHLSLKHVVQCLQGSTAKVVQQAVSKYVCYLYFVRHCRYLRRRRIVNVVHMATEWLR